jgi:beta-glucuronidase
MAQLYARHLLRHTLSLNGAWDFALDPDNRGRAEHWERAFPAAHGRLHVPGCWDTLPETFHYMGTGWYRRTVFLPAPGVARLVFEGVSGGATVYLDGQCLGSHEGTYTPFALLTGPLAAGDHELVVEVDNDHRLAKHFPEYPCDWLQYGGIVRDARCELLGPLYLSDLRVDYTCTGGLVELAATVTLHNVSAVDRREQVVLELDRQPLAAATLTVPAGAGVTHRFDLGARPLQRWQPGQPKLYEVRALAAGDDLRCRTGFRTVATRAGQLLLNDQPIRLLGINRHDEYGDQGFAMSPDLVQRDFELIASLGANAVRCHYPPSELALDLCDAMGLLAWDEIPFYARWPGVIAQQPYLQAGLAMLDEMIARDRHHPCVFTWSVLNECSTHLPEGVPTARALVERVRQLDPTRPVTYASNKLAEDQGYHLLDLIGINAYPGWYTQSERERLTWPVILQQLREKLAAAGLADRPLIVSETGAGAIYGDRGFESRKWSEGRQEEILADSLRILLADPGIAGVFIWQFADIRTANHYFNVRPHTFNNKGLVDRFRRPKDAWWKVRELYHAAAGRALP